MIDIQIEPAQFEYDIQSLVQAFYIGKSFKINDRVENPYRKISVKYHMDKICISVFGKGKKPVEGEIFCDFSDRRETKNILKKLLYKLLSTDTGEALPWGTLTGIRPSKIPEMMLEEGISREEIISYMKETYLISDEKLNLALDIAGRERQILSKINYNDGFSLYVGIPFCPTTCLYCSFTSFPIEKYRKKVDLYLDAVIKEIKYLGIKLKNKELNTVYIGGGTPTTLESNQLDRLINAIKDNFDFSTVVEFTVEAGRPDSITEDKIMVLKKHGVNRISINPQTMNGKTLEIIGRKHTVSQVKEAFDIARKCGMDNINMDFIVGLPGENAKMVKYSMDEALKLNPDGITVHSLALKRAARLNMEKERYSGLNMENSSSLMKITEEYAHKMKMAPYYMYRQKNMVGNQENVGYSRAGKEGIYNILMMGDYQDVWAAGAGAVTKLLSKDRKEGKRIDTLKNVDLYIDRIDEMIERKKVVKLD